MFKAIIDLETTGLKRNFHEIIEISCVVFNEKLEQIQTFTSLVQPYKWDIEMEALEVNGITIEQLKKAPTGMTVKGNFIKWRNEVLNGELVIPYGWNYKSFDMPFLLTWFGEENYQKIFHYRSEDIDSHLKNLNEDFDIFPDLTSYKLVEVCRYFTIPLKAHSSLPDCWATLEVLKRVKKITEQLKIQIRKKVKL